MTTVFSTSRLLAQVAALCGATIVCVAILSACDSDETSAARANVTATTPTTAVAPRTTELPPITATETVDPIQGADSGGGVTAAPRPASGGTRTDCAPDLSTSAQVSRDASRITPPRPGEQWRGADAGGTRCPGLSYIYLVGPGGAPTVPKQLLIYHNGYFQGTGIRCTVKYQEVSAAGPDAIHVIYRFNVPNQPSQSPGGEADVTFRWNGSKVVMAGSVPDAVTDGQC